MAAILFVTLNALMAKRTRESKVAHNIFIIPSFAGRRQLKPGLRRVPDRIDAPIKTKPAPARQANASLVGAGGRTRTLLRCFQRQNYSILQAAQAQSVTAPSLLNRAQLDTVLDTPSQEEG
jgi:hypothetical protein